MAAPLRSGLGLIVKVVRDWLPAILGLAITTGSRRSCSCKSSTSVQFYTANLLLFNRFMLLLPALIVGLLHALPDQEPGTGRAGRAVRGR